MNSARLQSFWLKIFSPVFVVIWFANEINSFIGNKIAAMVLGRIAADETEEMTLRILISPLVSFFGYGFSFAIVKFVVSLDWNLFILYWWISCSLWLLCSHLRKQFKLVVGYWLVLLQKRTNNESDRGIELARANLLSLRDHLHKLHDRSTNRS